jgi:hypothetical protein
MRKAIPVFAAVAAMSLIGATGASAAETTEARDITYTFSDEWHLAYIDGRPTVLPHMEDDYIEVKCLYDDQMTDWFANDNALVAGSYERVDGTGIQVQPHFTGENVKIKITITCHRA